MSKQINKITTGFVTQSYEDDQVVNCGFTAGDQVEYETPFGEPCDGPENEQYFGFDMIQNEQEFKVIGYALRFLQANLDCDVEEDFETKNLNVKLIEELENKFNPE